MGETRVHLPHHQHQMYCFGQNRPNVHQYAHVPHSDHRITQLCVLIDQLHLSYLHTEASPHKIEQRNKLERHIWEYLCEVPHDRKFTFMQTAQILRRSASSSSSSARMPYASSDGASLTANYSFNGFRAASAWNALDQYAANLLSQPWRKEFREMKLYSGFYKYEVESHLIGAEVMFELMGYRKVGADAMSLEGPIDPDRVASVSRDALFAYVECQILCAIWGMVPRKFSWLDLIEFRESHVSGPESAARVLTMRYLAGTSSAQPPISTYTTERADHKKLSTMHQNQQYNHYGPGYHQPLMNTGSTANSMTVPSRKNSQSGNTYGWPMQAQAIPNQKQRSAPPVQTTLGSDDFYPNGYAVHPGHLLHHQCNPLVTSHRVPTAHDCGPSGLVYPCANQYHCASHANGYHTHLMDTPIAASSVPTAQLVELDGARAMPYGPQSTHNYFSQIQSHPVVSVPVSSCQTNMAFGIGSQGDYCQQPHISVPHSVSYTTVPMANATLDSVIRRRGMGSEEVRDRQRGSFHLCRDNTDGIANDRMAATLGRGSTRPKLSYVSDSRVPTDGETLGSWAYVFQDLETQGYNKDLGDREDILNPRYREGDMSVSEEDAARNLEIEMKSERNLPASLSDPIIDKMGKTMQKLKLDSKRGSSTEEEKKKVAKASTPSHSTDEKSVSQQKESAVCEPPRGNGMEKNVGKLVLTLSPSSRNHDVEREAAKSSRAHHQGEDRGSEDWECTYCTFRNGPGGLKPDVCEICGKSRRRGAEEKPLASGGRECPKCTLVNVKEASVCEACGASLAHSPTYI